MGKAQRDKGKRFERKASQLLKPIFPQVQRNAGTQSREGGCDLVHTDPFNFEVKSGKSIVSVMIQKFLDQVQKEGQENNYNCVIAFPDRKTPYALLPLDDFIEILNIMREERLI